MGRKIDCTKVTTRLHQFASGLSSDKAKMSFNVGAEIATANHFIGLVNAHQRVEIHKEVQTEDDRRKFWVQYMLPKLTEQFLDKVIAKPYVRFHLDGLDDPNSFPPHTVFLQSFSYLCAPLQNVSARHMPWQFRFIIDKERRGVLESSLATDVALRRDVFDKAGWVFWIVRDGFCLAPKTLCDELSDISCMMTAWLKVRDEYEFNPKVAAQYHAEEEEALSAVPEPPKIERHVAESE